MRYDERLYCKLFGGAECISIYGFNTFIHTVTVFALTNTEALTKLARESFLATVLLGDKIYVQSIAYAV